MLEGQQARLTRAALETLSVVAYKQPVSRARVSAIRGVNVDGVMRTLLTRGLVEEAGQDELSGANLYRTTSYFLERIGVTSLDDLPELAPYLPDMDDLEDELASVAGLDAPGRARERAGCRAGSRRRTARSPAAAAGSAPRLAALRRRHRARRRDRDRMKPHDAPDNDQPASQRPDTDEDGLIRLQKLLAQSGVASRRKCEELMLDGLVEVDGEVVTRLGTKVDPRTAVIRVEGKRLPPISDKVYLVLNKPRGVVSTMSDPEGRRTLGDLVADRPERLFHVGRLDTDTEGLIILTNDGDFAQHLAHPSHEVDKTYVAEVDGEVHVRTIRELLAGVDAGGRSGHGHAGPGGRRRPATRGQQPLDRRAHHPRGSQPHRAAAARPRRPPGAAADPHRDRAGHARPPAVGGDARADRWPSSAS